MIKRLKYTEIDFDRYSNCVLNSAQNLFFAEKENLDILTKGNWELLVLNDYQAVMPVPLVRKFGIRLVLMPLFCPQLGVFSNEDSPEINSKFLNFLKKNYRVYYYGFNSGNHFSEFLEKRKNYIIEAQDYGTLHKKYFKGRKSTVKSAQHLTFSTPDFGQNVLDFIKNNFKGLKNSRDLGRYIHYLNHLHGRRLLRIFGAYKDASLISLAMVIADQGGKMHLLGLVNDDDYKAENGASFLVDAILKRHIQQAAFDFMGGNIRGIEVFFKSFGAKEDRYPYIFNSRKEVLRKLISKIF